MSDMMTFPATVEEFMEQYKIVDDEKVYTNGADLVPIFRMMQWLEHVSATDTISRHAAIMDAESWVAVDEHEKNLQKKVVEWLKEFPPAELGTNLAEVDTDCVSRRSAIEAVKFGITHVKAVNKETGEVIELFKEVNNELEEAAERIKQLPPAQPEQTGCEYCHEDVDGYVKPIEKNGHAFVRFGMNGWELELKVKGWHGDVKIQYCPMCGRKLKNDSAQDAIPRIRQMAGQAGRSLVNAALSAIKDAEGVEE